MSERTDRYVRAAVVGLAIVVVLTIGVGTSTSTASFSTYNTAWDGAAGLQSIATDGGATFTVATELDAAYQDPNATISIVLSPDRAYTPEEAQRMHRFVEQGGTLVVADDFGPHTNSLLSAMGSDVRIDGRLLRDEQRYDRTPNFSEATTTANASFVDTERTLTLNHGTALQPNGATVLAQSSEFSYLDTNQNYDLDESEELKSRPVATHESIGDGTAIVVSDPSMFINAMIERDGNRAFIAGLIEPHENVAVDYSHTERVPPLAGFLLWFRQSPVAQVIFGAGGLVLIGLSVSRPKLLFSVFETERTAAPTRRDTDALRRYLAERHPEWDEADLNRIMKGIMSDETKDTKDD